MDGGRSSGVVTEAEADALLSGRAVSRVEHVHEIISLMRTASAGPAPTPTARLAALLHDGSAPLPVCSAPSESRRVRWGVRIAAATAAAMTVTLGAATANALPAPLQAAVADVVEALTPVQLPRPAARTEVGSADTGGAVDQPAGIPTERLETRDPRTGVEGSSGEAAGSSPVMPETAPARPGAPAVLTPPRRTDVATPIDESDEPDAGRPDPDERDPDESAADVREGDGAQTDGSGRPETDRSEADRSEADPVEADPGEADERDPVEADETGTDGDLEPATRGTDVDA